MSSRVRNGVRAAVAIVFIFMFAVPSNLFAQEHVVTPGQIHQQLVEAAAVRQRNLDQVNSFFSAPAAKRVLTKAGVDIAQVKTAVSQLNNDELARLQARTDKVQRDLAAGSLTNQELTYIIIALATAVIVILILKA